MAARKKRGDVVRVWCKRKVMANGRKAKEWRWTRFSGNGFIVGCSSEAYVNKKECLKNVERMMAVCPVMVIDNPREVI